MVVTYSELRADVSLPQCAITAFQDILSAALRESSEGVGQPRGEEGVREEEDRAEGKRLAEGRRTVCLYCFQWFSSFMCSRASFCSSSFSFPYFHVMFL